MEWYVLYGVVFIIWSGMYYMEWYVLYGVVCIIWSGIYYMEYLTS